MVSVDDFESSCPTNKKAVEIEAPIGFGLFLGCVHEPSDAVVCGMEVKGYRYSMPLYV